MLCLQPLPVPASPVIKASSTISVVAVNFESPSPSPSPSRPSSFSPASSQSPLLPTPSPELSPVDVSEDLTPLPTLKAAGDAYINFDGHLSRGPLKYHEDVRSGCGGQTWPAGMVMGKHMLRYHREHLHDARILELGAGGGLVGLAVALECAPPSKMLLTDQIEMLDLMQRNIELNRVGNHAEAMVLNWGQDLPDAVIEQRPNVIIAAECVYFEPAFPLLMQTLRDLLVLNEDAVVYFCFKKRRRADMQFVKMARKAFHVEEVHDDDRPVFRRQNLFLFTFRSRKGQQQQQQQRQQKTKRRCVDANMGDVL